MRHSNTGIIFFSQVLHFFQNEDFISRLVKLEKPSLRTIFHAQALEIG